MKTNFLKLSFLARLTLVSTLQAMRIELKKSNIKKRRITKGVKRPKAKKPMTFFNDTIRKAFENMSPEMRDMVRKGGK